MNFRKLRTWLGIMLSAAMLIVNDLPYVYAAQINEFANEEQNQTDDESEEKSDEVYEDDAETDKEKKDDSELTDEVEKKADKEEKESEKSEDSEDLEEDSEETDKEKVSESEDDTEKSSDSDVKKTDSTKETDVIESGNKADSLDKSKKELSDDEAEVSDDEEAKDDEETNDEEESASEKKKSDEEDSVEVLNYSDTSVNGVGAGDTDVVPYSSAYITSFNKLEKDEFEFEYKLGLKRLLEFFPTALGITKGGNLYVSDEGTFVEGGLDTTAAVTWKCKQNYDDYLEVYEFEPVISGYEIAEEIKLPIITVTVLNEEDGSTGGYISIEEEQNVPELHDSSYQVLMDALEPAYNGYEAGRYPAVRNQGTEGACWAFANIGVVEADLISKNLADTSIDLSELQIAYFSAHQYDDPKNCHDDDTISYSGSNYLSNGGNNTMAYRTMINKVGPTEEIYAPYSLGNSHVVDDKYAMNYNYARIKNVYEIAISDVGSIKSAIKTHGGVAASFYSTESNWTVGGQPAKVRYSATYNSFYGQLPKTNHSIMLVGWDDNFPKENFHSDAQPEGDGAWLVRNSWGLDDYGKRGYFWLSYYDKGLESGGSVAVYDADLETYDYCYAYDGSPLNVYGISTTNYTSTETVSFNVDAGENVTAIGIETLSTNLNIDVTITDNISQNYTTTLRTTYAGFYTVDVTPLTVTDNTTFYVSLRISSQTGDAYKIPFEGCDGAGTSATVTIGEDGSIITYSSTYSSDTQINGRSLGDAKIKLYTMKDEGSETGDKLELTFNSIEDHKGAQHQLQLKNEDIDVSALTWSSIDEGVATVNAYGLVTVGAKKGSTAIIGEDPATHRTVECRVTVSPYTISYTYGSDVKIVDELPREYYPGDAANAKLNFSLYRPGYRFDGWYKDSALTQSVTDLNTQNTNLHLYPKWNAITMQVIYHELKDSAYEYLDSYARVVFITPEDMPYTLPVDYSYSEIRDNTNPNYYAFYYNKNASRKISFDYWSEDAAGNTKRENVTIDDYHFEGDDFGTGEIKAYYNTKSQLILYPQFSYINYNITYNLNGGTNSPLNKSTYERARTGVVTLAAPTRTGYEFGGWYETSDFSSDPITSIGKYDKKDYVLYAKWTKQVQITLDLQGGELGEDESDTVYATYNSNYGTLPNPTKEGYEFKGWFTNAVTGSQIYSTTRVTKTEDHTIYARWGTVSLTVGFDTNSNVAKPANQSITFGSPYGVLPSLSREGYNFDGWYTEKEGGTKVESTTLVSNPETHTLYAHWSGKTYTVSFNANGGTVDTSSKTATYNENYGTLPTPSRTGYEFDGWYDAQTGGNKITAETRMGKALSHTLYAHWTAEEYTVSYDANGGSCDTSSKQVAFNSNYFLPEAARTGYHFDGWYTLAEGGSKLTDTTKLSTAANHTVYAHWTAETYKVSFESNLGFLNSSDPAAIWVTYDSAYGTLPTPTRLGYVFKGWHDKASAGNLITSTTIVSIASDHTIYAYWDGADITVTFDPNAADAVVSETNRTVTVDKLYTKDGALPTPVRPGFNFGGWYLDAACTGESISSTTVVDTKTSHSIYAKWTPASFTVSFNPNGGTVQTTSGTYTNTVAYGTLPTPNRTGYNFDGWYTASIGGTLVNASSAANLTSDITLYAHWNARNYKLNFDVNASDGQVLPTYITVTYGEEYGENAPLPTPTRPGYDFDGWYTFASGGTKITDDMTVINAFDSTAYAHWTGKTYTVSFNANGGEIPSGTADTKVVTYGDLYGTLPEPVMDDYSFAGWYTAEEKEDGVLVTPGTIVELSDDQTLYAQWIEGSDSVCVFFDANGGILESEESIIVTYDEEYGTLPIPTKDNASFDGWYTDKDTIPGVKISETTIVDRKDAHTLYARWKPAMYMLYFDGNGGEVSAASRPVMAGGLYGVVNGERKPLPTATRAGHNFLGWFTQIEGGEVVSENRRADISSDQFLYAHWDVVIKFDFGVAGVSPVTRNVIPGWSIGTLPEVEREGYTFEGWYTQPKGGEKIQNGSAVNITQDATYYARYSLNKYTVTFNPNGGKVDQTTTEVAYGYKFGSLPIPERDGYTFDGWFDKQVGGNVYIGTKTVDITNDITLYAHWRGRAVIVNLDPNGGELTETSISTYMGQEYAGLPTPERRRYDFAGWYTKPEGGELVTKATKVVQYNTHTLYAHWTKSEGAPVTPAGFKDVPVSQFYYDPVNWAFANGITTGTSKTTFSPNNKCTRGQVVTFLWRAYGSPEPTTNVSPFSDVQDSTQFYYKAVLWAVENKITTGTSKTTFSPNATVTRGQFVTFLYRAEGSPAVEGANPFGDINPNDFYYNAVLWAAQNGVTTGTSKTTFSPKAPCTRGQVVTFIYRDMK